MILQDLIDTYEELKNNVYIVRRGNQFPIIITFNDNNFFHLVGLHKTNLDHFIPQQIKSKAKKYKYIKSHIEKFNSILESELKENNTLQYRIYTFPYILDLLEGKNISLYSLHQKINGSVYNGDYGLLKIYETFNCLLGLVISDYSETSICCAPQSWMASTKVNYLTEFKRPIYIDKIVCIPTEMFDNSNNLVSI